MSEAIVVTGLGFVCPLGTGSEAVWRAWQGGESGVRRPSADDSRLGRGIDPIALPDVGSVGLVRGFEPRDHIRSPHLRRMDWCSRMIVASAVQAVSDAGLSLDDEREQVRTGLVVGSCFGNQRETEKYLTRVLRDGPGAGQPILFPNLVLNASAGYAAIELSLRGPNVSVSQHEASGEVAVATALDLLRAGWCDRIVVAGADEFGAVYLSALRERRLLGGDAQAGPSRSDANRGRMTPGEGAAALVLERAEDARERGRDPRARVAFAVTGAVSTPAYRAPEPLDAAQRMLAMIDDLEVPKRAVSALLGGANGARPRDELDRALLARLAARQPAPAEYVLVDAMVGDWGSRGLLAVALAALALDRRELPGVALGDRSLERILVPGSGRGGVLVPVVLDAAETPG